MYRLFNVLCWLWNIYGGAKLPSVYFITNTKHCITYLALTKLFPVAYAKTWSGVEPWSGVMEWCGFLEWFFGVVFWSHL